mmetsp:Transcript_8055/g.12176  ORF Transcript_8055/g.12176 Transcript_8055/m.12176 type:complete len:249 (-) Transcript_8055:262-1008(-)
MKIQYVLRLALLAWGPATTILEVNANNVRVETLTLTRKRDAPLPAALLNVVNKDHPRRQEVKLSEEEEMFLRYLQEATSHSQSYDAPSEAPTKTGVLPSKSPSQSPSQSPTEAPTKAPVTSSPTKVATTAAPVAGGSCKDSGTKFVLSNDTGAEKKLKGCEWVGNNQTEKRCGYKGVASHCPNTCGACAAYSCADSEKGFVKWGKNKKTFTCEWVKKNASVITKRCNMTGIAATCRETCKYVGNGLSC